MIAQLDKKYLKIRPYKVFTRLVSYFFFEGRPLTTKGRWINSIVFANYKMDARIPVLKKVEKPIFILGTGRSGTTILGMLLSMHKQVGYLNEPKAFWNYIYDKEDLIGSYTDKEATFRLSGDVVTPTMIKKAHRVYSFYLLTSFSKRVVDKYPELIYRTGFVRKIFPDAKFIFLVRNGWDTCASIDSWSKRLGVSEGDEQHDWWGKNKRKWNLMVNELVKNDPELSPFIDDILKFEDHKNMAAVEWILTMKEGLRIMNNHEEVFLVKYEDIVRDQQTLTKILDYCELPPDEKFFDYARQVLNPAPDKAPFTLHASILPEFERVMKLLAYNK